MKIIAATSNKGKIKEIKSIFSEKDFEIISMKEAGLEREIEETGVSFEENALIKARAIAKLCNCAVLSDDSGLCVDALDGAPGIYSARYAGEGATDEERVEKLLNELSEVKDRSAKFVSACALVYPDGKELVGMGEVHGRIGFESKGKNGFGYDPIFISDELNKTFAQATEEEKNSVSHRKRALSALYKKMRNEE
ncbi:MAG: XTP/dITP diphosphatase [Clostridia bacterium]|nr:XTP/dITP diphosphatase [Clostridia bacterium]